ncbi:MAG: methyltransferase domain-containing protein [Alphaproteobacteria bacterium]|nr:methyltransferase domain-containing protein [Alphaproteobacteria bacterium]
MLAATYDNFIEVVTVQVPGGTLLDVACNNGYFPVSASLRGCSRAVGLDPGSRTILSVSVGALNAITGAKAEFLSGGYSSDHHLLYTAPDGVNATPFEETFDIVTNSALLCHMSEPLYFLSTLSRHARRALLIYSGFIEDDDYLFRYNSVSNWNVTLPFPNCFNDGTAMSIKLFRESMRLLGFKSVEQIAPPPTGLQDREPFAAMKRYGTMKAFLCLR